MSKLHYIDEGLDYIVSELICINCKHRFIDMRPIQTWLKDLDCPNCKEKGYMIETGEVISDEQFDKICNEEPNYVIYRHYNEIY